MRYRAQFRNGIWQVFDTIWYGVVGAFTLGKRANERAAELNARKGKP